MKKLLILNSVLLICTNSVFAADATTPAQQDIDAARDQNSKQLQDTYKKNEQKTLKEEAGKQSQNTAPPPKSSQPLWEQAINPPNAPGVNTPATPPPAQTTPAAPDPTVAPAPPLNPFQTPADQSNSLTPNFYR